MNVAVEGVCFPLSVRLRLRVQRAPVSSMLMAGPMI
nr:MAG TPA: hypothetical protein [Caudoviricetes sp.]